MTRNFTALIFFIFSFSILSAQQVKLQNNAYSLLLPEGKTTFRVDETQVLVQFKGKLSHKVMSDFFASQGIFKPFEKEWILPFPDAVVAKLKADKISRVY